MLAQHGLLLWTEVELAHRTYMKSSYTPETMFTKAINMGIEDLHSQQMPIRNAEAPLPRVLGRLVVRR